MRKDDGLITNYDGRYRPVKLEDIAKQLSVSSVTVSKALRDHPDISDQMKVKVRDLAAKLGYVPNIIARNLSARKSNTIGLVVPKIAHIFFSSIIEAVYDAGFRKGYEIILTVSQEQAERERKHIHSLLSMRVDGLIISVTQETKDLSIFQRVIDSGKPMIFIDRIPDLPDITCVSVDDFGGAFNAVEYAVRKGYRKIGHIGGYNHINIGKDRYEGFMAAMKKFKMPVNPDWVVQTGFSEEDGYRAFMSMMTRGQAPEFVLAVTYPVALGMLSAAIEMGINIPGSIEVTCFGRNTFHGSIPAPFNFVHQPAGEIGRKAMELMLALLNDPEGYEHKRVQLKTELMISKYNMQGMLVV
jgi:LacI family transcriptional regulator